MKGSGTFAGWNGIFEGETQEAAHKLETEGDKCQ